MTGQATGNGWAPVPELFELVRWETVKDGDHVWSMGDVCVIDGDPFRHDDDYDNALPAGVLRFRHRNQSGTVFAPPMELRHLVPRLLPPGRGPAEDAARAAFAGALSGLHADMLNRGDDITDDGVWKPAKREFLRALIKVAQRELHGTTWLARNATGEGP